MNRGICPCCGYPTLEERAACDICMLCNWEDLPFGDSFDRFEDVDPNGNSGLAESRRNFNKYYIMYSEKRIINRQTPKEIEAKKALISAYHECEKYKTDLITYKALWRKAKVCEKHLRSAQGCDPIGVYFFVANTFQELSKSDEYILLEDNPRHHISVMEYYRSRRESPMDVQHVNLLLQLGSYSKKKYNVHEINTLIQVCEKLLHTHTEDERNDRKVREFVDDLKDLCQMALSTGQFVIAVGTESNIIR